ncbi:thiol-disulfide isomerase/thioredoxin [Nocardioides zeae]|uniref:Thiol-disulfide isomerase/thioredoxin n=2 Tax=Nocardioides zeae TaxID=1457234 RepID=A0ACC6IMB5_9ACTN|nr:TlpA disulfide reductase family protein [Nocardioides zeae]MDQ1106499.1 thiol-disulfide isomerase/thioredoxin [Nocardioides zeae]MDR6173820.1 thiol-disulfide isomerase/thioredoxin [Nocardioides zeae]MDR6211892.1 thiol-disulfide isomerase/thioredoxin [Nocardioides zeae]
MRSGRRRTSRFAAAALALVALAGCTSGGAEEESDPFMVEPRPPGAPDIDYDSPALQEARAAAGIEACAPGDRTSGPAVLPELTLPCLGGGEPVDLSTFEGPLLVNVWASFCGPCRHELPALQQFHEQYGDEVTVLGIDYNETRPDEAIALLDETGATFPQLIDVDLVLGTQRPFVPLREIPKTVVVDADGEVTVLPQSFDDLDDLLDAVAEPLGLDR